jgi:hypothetical protein
MRKATPPEGLVVLPCPMCMNAPNFFTDHDAQVVGMIHIVSCEQYEGGFRHALEATGGSFEQAARRWNDAIRHVETRRSMTTPLPPRRTA